MKKYIFMAVMGVLLQNVVAMPKGDATAGKALSASCVACHGATGNSVNPIWPNIAGQHATYLYSQLKAFKQGAKGGRNNPTMAAMVMSFDDKALADLSAYYAQQKPAVLSAKNEALEYGQQVYRGGDRALGIPACSACHGANGLGNGPANFPKVSGQHAAYALQQLQDFRSGARSNDYNHIMGDIAKKMSDNRMKAVANYMQGLH